MRTIPIEFHFANNHVVTYWFKPIIQFRSIPTTSTIRILRNKPVLKSSKHMKASINAKGILTLEIQTHAPEPSKSGTTHLIASERQRLSDVVVNGLPVTIQLNAWVKPLGK